MLAKMTRKKNCGRAEASSANEEHDGRYESFAGKRGQEKCRQACSPQGSYAVKSSFIPSCAEGLSNASARRCARVVFRVVPHAGTCQRGGQPQLGSGERCQACWKWLAGSPQIGASGWGCSCAGVVTMQR